jgi:response regulator receiver domain-containing protein
VDDDDDVRGVLHATLESKGFDVAAAANVTQALKLITTESFDALITDTLLWYVRPVSGYYHGHGGAVKTRESASDVRQTSIRDGIGCS